MAETMRLAGSRHQRRCAVAEEHRSARRQRILIDEFAPESRDAYCARGNAANAGEVVDRDDDPRPYVALGNYPYIVRGRRRGGDSTARRL